MDIIQVLIDTLYFYWSFFLSTFRMLLEWFETTSSNIPNITDLYPFHITSCSFRIILQYAPKKENVHGCTWTDLPSQKHLHKNPTLSCREPQAAHRHCPIQYPFPLLPYGGPGTSPGPGAIGAIELELAALGAPQWDIRCFQGEIPEKDTNDLVGIDLIIRHTVNVTKRDVILLLYLMMWCSMPKVETFMDEMRWNFI